MTKKHTVELTDAEIRQITKLAVAEEARQAQAVAAKHKARAKPAKPKTRAGRGAALRRVEAEIAASKPDSRLVYRGMRTG
ncbi:hypothetical protein [Bradyrhizobium sp. LB11.1]|uniref:hypothetical protein n=1 Tax=Bradyrhizobium sp. LB11.1 TaxID=3156326 RepID=UPI003393CDCA